MAAATPASRTKVRDRRRPFKHGGRSCLPHRPHPHGAFPYLDRRYGELCRSYDRNGSPYWSGLGNEYSLPFCDDECLFEGSEGWLSTGSPQLSQILL